MKTVLALLLVAPLLSGCWHYAFDDNADDFYRGLWAKTGVCVVFHDGSTVNCKE
jgi:hypothetical protein